jgi:Ca-activated chloride channel family protein
MGAGLNAALSLLETNQTHRARKILLLSDGQANQGVTNPELLGQMASRATQYGAVLSSIGMGLGFNETLMAKLADYGMGHYSYLEDLSGLGSILARDLNDTRNIYANSSTLEIKLGDGVQLIDAGGYPITHSSSSTIRVSTGQMLSNTQKHFVMTFRVPNRNIGSVSLADMQLNYQTQGQNMSKKINQQLLNVSVVAPENREQALQSIDKDVYQNSWLTNNFGIMQKKLSKWMREGKKEKAKQEIVEYRKKMAAAGVSSNMALASPEVKNKLNEMEDQVDQAFMGSLLDQQVKRNRAAKSMQYDSISKQRK